MTDTYDLDILKTKLMKRKNSNVLPGQTFRLPSLGKRYEPGVLSEDVVDGEIVLFPMSTLDEIYIKTPEMLFQGTAIEEVIKRRAPQVLDPLKLIPKDVDYILSALRQITYGDIMEITYTCENPDCEHKNHKAIAKVSNFLRKAKTLEFFDESKLTFDIDGFVFETKFSTYGDLIKLNQKNVNNTLDTPEELYSAYIDNLALNIKSIDGIENPSIIHTFLFNDADSVFQQRILTHIQSVNEWGVEFKQDFVCEKCAKVNSIPIAVNPSSFFTQPSEQAM